MKAIEFSGDGVECTEDSVTIKGVFHLSGVISDFTLCGITLDGDEQTAGSYETVSIKAINCPDCVKIIKSCRGVKIADYEDC